MAGSFGPDTRIGLVGLGIMGVPIAKRLAGLGHAVTAWNLEPERFDLVSQAGVQWAQTPARVRAASDIVLLCVLGDDAVEACVFGPDGFLAADGAGVLIDLSTTSPEATARLAPRAAGQGLKWIDAPMSGGPGAIEEGGLTLLLGGDVDLCAAVRPVLDAIASNITRMGASGAGQRAKVLNQAIVGVNYMLMAELCAMARAGGIDPAQLPGALAGGMADSTILQRILPQMAARDYTPPRGYARQLAKDLAAVQGFADGLDLDLPVLARAIADYRAFAQDHPMADGAEIAETYARKG